VVASQEGVSSMELVTLLLTCIWKVLGSNLGLNTDNLGVSAFFLNPYFIRQILGDDDQR
jgi:hypothetical protein